MMPKEKTAHDWKLFFITDVYLYSIFYFFCIKARA
jgi:hypothetical protein